MFIFSTGASCRGAMADSVFGATGAGSRGGVLTTGGADGATGFGGGEAVEQARVQRHALAGCVDVRGVSAEARIGRLVGDPERGIGGGGGVVPVAPWLAGYAARQSTSRGSQSNTAGPVG